MTVIFQVTGTLSMTCDGTATLTSAPGTRTTGTGSMGTASCYPNTNNSNGYTLSWKVMNSSGTTTPQCWGNCWGTGHMLNQYNTAGKPDTIRAFDRKGYYENRPGQFDDTTILTGSGARWAARLRANSTTNGGAGIDWGADGNLETFLNVSTGATVAIARRNSPTGAQNDNEAFLFKVVIPDNIFQPTGTYKVQITFTVSDN